MRLAIFLCFAILSSGCAPVILKAARKGDTERIKSVLESGRVGQKDLDRALCIAAGTGRKEMLELLLNKGANPKMESPARMSSFCPCGTKLPRPPVGRCSEDVCIGTPLMCAALFGHSEIVATLVSKGAPVNAIDNVRCGWGGPHEGKTALLYAAAQGHGDTVRLLLNHGADSLQKDMGSPRCVWKGKTAFDWAEERGHKEVARLLRADMERRQPGIQIGKKSGLGEKLGLLKQVTDIAGGFVPGLSQANDLLGKVQTGISAAETGRTLYQAARPAAAESIAEQPPPTISEPPLHASAEAEDAGALRRLLEAGADVDERCADGATPLMHAAAKGSVEIVKALLDAKAGVNARNANGVTALMTAALAGRSEAASALLRAGADPNLKAKNGATALSLAEAAGHTDIAVLLKTAGARR